MFVLKEASYHDSIIMDSGQTVEIEFFPDNSWHKWYYGIYLVTYHKRKGKDATYLKSTGKDGLKGLIWAKNKIKEFEEFIVTEHTGTAPIVIYCQWDDNRRRRVYEKGLKDLGFKYGYVFGSKALLKEITMPQNLT